MATTLQQSPPTLDEIDRLRRVYKHRIQLNLAAKYSRTNPGHLFALHEREATMAALFHSAGLDSLTSLRILDLGCGAGATLRQYLEYGANSDQLCGIDLLPEFAEKARSLHLQVTCGSASDLPFPDCSFDLVSQFTLFTSVLDPATRRRIADEMDRVLRPGGKILWYDFAVDNPANPDVRGVRMAEVRQLFPGYSIATRRITLAPPLGRMIGHLGPTLYFLVSKFRFLCTHYLCLLQKRHLI